MEETRTTVQAYSLDQIVNILRDRNYSKHYEEFFNFNDLFNGTCTDEVARNFLRPNNQFDRENILNSPKFKTLLRAMNSESLNPQTILVMRMSFINNRFIRIHSDYNELCVYDVGILENISPGPTTNEFFKYLPEDVKRMYLMNTQINNTQKRNFEIVHRACHYECVQNDWNATEETIKKLSSSTL